MNLRRILISIFALFVVVQLQAQLINPVKWTTRVDKVSDSEANLVMTAVIDKTWHLFSQHTPSGGGLPTVFTFEPSRFYQKVGPVYEYPKPKEVYEEVFRVNEKFFEGTATFTQRIKIIGDKPFTITVEMEGQSCNEGTCVQVSETMTFQIDGSQYNKEKPADTMAVIEVDTPETASKVEKTDEPQKFNNDEFTGENKSLWWFFIQAFGWGLLAILTPCVFPMIPMTVSYFMKSGKKGKTQAMIYGISIIAIYVIFGVLLAIIFGEEFGNWLSTHWIPNVLFFLIFVIFAASFFGYFEIKMPSWLVNKSVQNEDKGGTMGTIFMALTLVLVSFSCTGPIVGTVAIQAVGGQIMKPIIGMLGFSLAFAIPFTLFAFFPRWLDKLPKSGGWLNAVKVVLGFIELAFALKFLNVPDQTYHWGILDREVYLSLWIVIFTMMGFYLLGKLKFPHDSDYPIQKSFGRLMLAIATFTFVIYLIPGLWGAPLKAISGWIPPMETQDFDVNRIVRENSGSQSGYLSEEPKYSGGELKFPLGLEGYFDYDQALKVSEKENKPLFIDFTGHGCTNCRQMENQVWSDPEVLKRLRENFVMVALYVDDKVVELPESEWYTNQSGKKRTMLGEKNSDIQKEKYKSNGQPYYFIVDHNEVLMAEPRVFDLDIDEYIAWLDRALLEYKNRYSNDK